MPSDLAVVLRIPGSGDFWIGLLTGVLIVHVQWFIERRRGA